MGGVFVQIHFHLTLVNLGSDLCVRISLTDLTEMTLADEDNNSITTDDANRGNSGATW